MTPEAPVFPIFLKLGGRRVVVVGGGKMAASKLGGLLHSGASVAVVARGTTPEIDRSTAIVLCRGFEPSDLDGA